MVQPPSPSDALCPLPEVAQVAWVVRDIERAMAEFTRLFQVGPWLQLTLKLEDQEVHGERRALSARLALTQLGAVQLELIEPLDDQSIYVEHLERHGEGLHHLGFLCEDAPARLEQLRAHGAEVLQAGRIGQMHYAYLTHPASGGAIIELIEATPDTLRLFERVRRLRQSA